MHRSHQHPAETAPVTSGRTIRWAQHYDLLVRFLTLGREKSLRADTLRYAAIAKGAAVLDVGCGTGTLTLLAKAEAGDAGRVHGIDAAPEMIATARQKAQQQNRAVDFQIGVIEALPFPDSTFDVVLSSLMMHHLPPDVKQRGLAEIYRVLKPGGHLLVVDMKRPVTLWQRLALTALLHHDLRTEVNDLIPLMTAIGFVASGSGRLTWRSVGYVRGSRPLSPP